MDTNGWKTQSRTTKALQSLSSKSKEEKSTKRTLGHKTGPCSLQKRETRVKDGEQWPRVWDFSGLWAGWHFRITNHTEGLWLPLVSYTGDKQELRKAATGPLLPQGLGGALQGFWNSVLSVSSLLCRV